MATKSSRKIKKRTFDSDNESDKGAPAAKQIRGCPRSGCVTKAPICFARATNICCGNGYTSRWYHLSLGEHYCNECFEYYYRSHKGGFEEYSSWKRLWSGFGKCECGVREYMMDRMLAYWVKCNLCGKWRQVYRETELTPEFLRSYVCTRVMKNQSQEKACEALEDYRVQYTRNLDFWSTHLCYRLLIKNAIYAPYVRSFFPDKVGISPSDTSIHKYEEGITEVRPYLHPLQDVVETSLAFCLPPHYLADEENDVFHQFAQQNLVNGYLIIRNTAVTLWNLNVRKWVTVDRCMNHIHMRGLARVWIAEQVAPVLHFLTEKGFINHGIASIPKQIDFLPKYQDIQKHLVIIVGAGLAGLSAARQLTNFGLKVKVLEAADYIGGRAIDPSNQIAGTGSHVVAGCYNNPLVVMCKQGDITLQELDENCVLLDEAGERVDDKTDKRMQFHFEAMLDNNKQLKHEQEKDRSLLDRFNELHEQFKEESGIPFSKLEEGLLQFHVSNLEYACGSNLANVSSMYWDQNEDHPQFLGPPVLIQDGIHKILDTLAQGVDIVKNCEVCSLDYTSQAVQVTCTSGEMFDAAKVLVTTSLDVLKKGKIKFTPDLPESKEITLGCGHVEKIVLEFPNNFWAEKTKNCTTFGRVSTNSAIRGMFDVFYDLSKPSENRHILVSYISGEAIDQFKDKSDGEVVSDCVQVLQKLFTKEEVPEPVKSYVSHWRNREHVNMSYSYIPINAGEDAFDKMEQDLAGKVFFAGEATHKQFYQTLAGAYISGLREAEKVYRSLTVV